ncbi:DUF3014 domain-containing protein [Piscinibacter sakaiensis]|uniref:DUF3014 domain-containing protein n=1 Tax=Piscinibacter sakaiensis TaxID=1547922 RepID=UPI003AAB2E6B
MNKTGFWVILALMLLALAAMLAWFWQQSGGGRLVTPPPPLPPTSNAPYDAIQPPPGAASQPAVLFPVEPAASDPQQITSADFEPGQALAALLGSEPVLEFLQTGDFPRRFAATVDNLGRSHAPPSVWPLNPTPDRFLTEQRNGKTYISEANAERYRPLVKLLTSIDIAAATSLYVQIYPLLQKAYENLGFPNRHFNDRFVAVIDQLLATPEPGGPLQVQLTEVKGPMASTRPWVRYEYADPGYEQLSAGQKILLRVGAENRRKLKAQLIELRRSLTSLVRQR